MSAHKTKVLIIGSGPAGYSAAIYAARANLSPILVSGYDQGGQLTTTTDVENYPGFANVIQGPWLMEQMLLQAKHVGTEIINDYISKVDLSKKPFIAIGDSGDEYIADSIIISTGAQAKWLNNPSEQKFKGYGVSGCATCDGFFFKNKIVGVIGGGNTATEEALYLTNHASQVYLIHRKDKLKSEKILQDRLLSHPKITTVFNYELDDVYGDESPLKVRGVKLKSTNGMQAKNIELDGLFIAIGHKPSTDLFKEQIDLDEEGYIKVLPGGTQTNIPGVFAAGDVCDKKYRQAVTAAGTGCMAALDVIKYLETTH
jgi:thioredoxin reductase (NADPH)